MKRFFTGLIFMAAVAASAVGCKEEYITYEGPSYVMFSDTLSVYPIQQSGQALGVDIVATRTSDHDRTFGVEIVNKGSDAIYNYHYTLESSTVTIKAGENRTKVNILGKYDNMETGDSFDLKLRLVSLENIEWDLYGVDTKVRLQKSCPYDINNFSGYALVSSYFLYEFKGQAGSRLVKTELVDGEENTVLVKGLFYEGYDIKLKLDPADPWNYTVKMEGPVMIADTREVFDWPYSDNRLLAEGYPGYTSTFDTCEEYVTLHLLIYVKDEGTVGGYTTYIEWISDTEALDYL